MELWKNNLNEMIFSSQLNSPLNVVTEQQMNID